MSKFTEVSIYGELPKQPCIYAACDSNYFIEHGPAFVYSADNVNKPVHIHVINPTKDAIALAGVLNATTKINITYTFHDVIEPTDKDQRRTLYACIRFLCLPQILQSAKKVMTLDIDCLLMKPFDFPAKGIGYFPREKSKSKEMKVAAGALYFDSSEITVAKSIQAEIKKIPLKWFADQIALHNVLSVIPKSRVIEFDNNFMDWEFQNDTTIWTGKGKRKFKNTTYVNEKKKVGNIEQRTSYYNNVILKPRLDLIFKKPSSVNKPFSDPVRVHWENFSNKLSNTTKNSVIVEMPQWMLNNNIIQYFPNSATVYVPHHERKFWGGNQNTKFYMQTVFPWLFTIDSNGWGGHADFVKTFNNSGDYDSKLFDSLSSYVKKGGTKFQSIQATNKVPTSISAKKFIFVPLQLPHDLVIKNHSPISCEKFVKALCAWNETQKDITVVFKGHPRNLKSMEPLKKIIKQYKRSTYVDNIHIHDLMRLSSAVYVINSGTGQEAMLFDKPVVAFGAAEYQGAVIRGNIKDLDQAWNAANCIDVESVKETYRRWYYWYEKNIFNTG
jgi:hypothetical protein